MKNDLFAKTNIQDRAIAVKFVQFPSTTPDSYVVRPLGDGLGFSTDIDDMGGIGASLSLIDTVKAEIRAINGKMAKTYAKFRRNELKGSYDKTFDAWYVYLNIFFLLVCFALVQTAIGKQNMHLFYLGLAGIGLIVATSLVYMMVSFCKAKTKKLVYITMLSDMLDGNFRRIDRACAAEGFYLDSPHDLFWLKIGNIKKKEMY